MKPTNRSDFLFPGFKRDHLASPLLVLWILAALVLPTAANAAAARPAVVLGSFSEPSNAAAMLQQLAQRNDLAGAVFAIASNTINASSTSANSNATRSLSRVVAYGQDPSQTSALLSQLRDAGFTSAWYLADAQIAAATVVATQTTVAAPANPPTPAIAGAASQRNPASNNAAANNASDISASDNNADAQVYVSMPAVLAAAEEAEKRRDVAIEKRFSATALVSEPADPAPKLAAPTGAALSGKPAATNAQEQMSLTAQDTSDTQNNTDQPGLRGRTVKALKSLNVFRYMPGLGTVKSAFAGESLQWSIDAKASQSSLPSNDLKRPYFDAETSSYVADLHVEWQQSFDNITLSFDHVLQWNAGDVIPWSRSPYGAPELRSLDDRPRMFDLTNTVADGNRYRLHSHFKELMARWEGEQWSVGVGRDHIDWGTGIVFHPMDLFNPLPPLHIEGDDQIGQDHIMVERVWNRDANPTQSLSFVHVGRRDGRDDITADVSTTAVKWHRKSDRYAFGVTAAQHYARAFVGLEAARQLDAVTVSSNLTFRERDGLGEDSSWGLIGVVNARLDLSTEERSASVFAEYFHNGFGLDALPERYLDLPADLNFGLARQETFTLMRNYIALGGDFAWNNALKQNLELMMNLHDRSAMVKTEFSYMFRDYLRLQFGLITQVSQDGDEFAPLQIGITPSGDPVTWGGGSRVYLRWEFSS